MEMELFMQKIQQGIEVCDALSSSLPEGSFSYGLLETEVKSIRGKLKELLTQCGLNSLSDKRFLFYANMMIGDAMHFRYAALDPLRAPMSEAREMLQQAQKAIPVSE